MSTVETTTKPASPALPREVVVVLAILVVSAMIMILNETILSVALPAIMEDFQIPETTAQWLTTGFMLTMAVVIPTTGYLLDRFSTKTIFVTALLFFLVGTLVAALAPTFAVLLTARIIQAVGTALIMPLLMTVTLTVVPMERRGAVMGIISIVISVAPALGPTVSGFILNSLTWHWLFWIMLPIVAVAFIVGTLLIENIGENRISPLDIPSVLLSAVAFGGLVYGFSSIGAVLNGDSTTGIVVIIVDALALAIFIRRQLQLGRQDRALMDLRPFRIRNFTFALVAILLAFGAMLGTVMVLPIYLQTSLGVTALVTGLVVMPGGLLQGLVAPFIGRFYDKVGPRPLLIPGAILLTAAAWSFALVTSSTPVGMVVGLHIVFSIGMCLMMTPLMTTALGSLPRILYGHGSAILNTLQQLAGAAGTAIMIAALSLGTALAGGAEAEAVAAGARTAFVAGAIIATIALVASLFVTRVEET
ncbi:drug resistance MFS transporter, drug:H+ antiporter-2 family [Corynebacterium efficiens YS-314]|uniref:DHA2 family efflux MFS transporter permease subunit n=1 Tax=Corynebacterium efficiens TaxID=152794 RepID=UPI0001B86ED7|nr:DHA2 family efflux MFS transporter permease subunit [Corynebacterium efficiens]EEW51051.1 drug resistance MFS transporter, drug:H+ antiporter-2 family [Corynebacterium efficiens YS-314]